MASTLNQVSVTASISYGLISGVTPDIISAVNTLSSAVNLQIGTSTGQPNAIMAGSSTITSGTPVVVDVFTGTDPLGATPVMLHVFGIMVINNGTVTGNDITVGAGTHPLMGSGVTTVVQSGAAGFGGGVFLNVNTSPGFAITSGSADSLTFTVSAGTAVPFKYIIIGSSN